MNDFDGLKLDTLTPDDVPIGPPPWMLKAVGQDIPSGIGKTASDASDAFFDIVDAIVMLVGPSEAANPLRKTATAIEEESQE